MTALSRRRVAATDTSSPNVSREPALRAWSRAESIRDEWLDHALSAKPADRALTEHTIIRIYSRLGRPRPGFVWVGSPIDALPFVNGLPTLDDLMSWVRGPRPTGRPPLASDLAAEASRLRTAMDDAYERPPFDFPPPKRKKDEPWLDMPPREAIQFGVPFREVLRRDIWSYMDDRLPRLGSLGELGRLPICWYGRHEAGWVAYYDTLRRLGIAHYSPAADRDLDDWVALARSCEWWWPGPTVCTVVDPGAP